MYVEDLRFFKLPKETKIVWRGRGGGGKITMGRLTFSSSYQEIREMDGWLNRN